MCCCFSCIYLDFYIVVLKMSWNVITCMLNMMDCRPPGISICGISQARLRAYVPISSSMGSSQPRNPTHIFCVSCIGWLFFLPLSHLGSTKDINLNEIENLSWNPMSTGVGSRWQSKKIQSSSLMNTPKLQLHIEQLFLRMTWRLAE